MHRRKIIAAVLGIIMALASCPAAYAFEGGAYHDFRDGQISVYLPEGWKSEEMIGFEGNNYEQIFEAREKTGKSGLHFEVYFMTDEAQTDDYVYFDDDEDAALEYYENYGEEALDTFYLELPNDGGVATQSTWEFPAPEFFDGQLNGFLVTEVSGWNQYAPSEPEEFVHTVYLTAGMTDDSETVVHNILVFCNDDSTALTEEQARLAKEVADEFYDYGYGDMMAGVKSEDSLWSDEFDMSSGDEMDTVMTIIGIVSVIAPLVIIAAVVVIIVKRAAGRSSKNTRGAAGAANVQQSFHLDDTISRWKKRRAEKDSFSGKERRNEKRTERREERRSQQRIQRRSTMQMRTREAESAEQRYYESLKTLNKTGLLTKDEMKDMLERHERSRVRQRKR